MQEFEFGDTRIALKICGKEYRIEAYGDDVIKAGDAYAAAMEAVASIQSKDLSKAIIDANIAGAAFLDALFGENERKRIMSGNENNLLAYQEVISFITTALLAFRAKKTADMVETAVAVVQSGIGETAAPQ